MLLMHLHVDLTCAIVFGISVFLLVSGSDADCDCGTPWAFNIYFQCLFV